MYASRSPIPPPLRKLKTRAPEIAPSLGVQAVTPDPCPPALPAQTMINNKLDDDHQLDRKKPAAVEERVRRPSSTTPDSCPASNTHLFALDPSPQPRR